MSPRVSLPVKEADRDRPPTIICPSMLSSDFARLADESKRMLELGADWLHLDVMAARAAAAEGGGGAYMADWRLLREVATVPTVSAMRDMRHGRRLPGGQVAGPAQLQPAWLPRCSCVWAYVACVAAAATW
eukprot:57178-Chlamydomonas_euryale.AAC.4